MTACQSTWHLTRGTQMTGRRSMAAAAAAIETEAAAGEGGAGSPAWLCDSFSVCVTMSRLEGGTGSAAAVAEGRIACKRHWWPGGRRACLAVMLDPSADPGAASRIVCIACSMADQQQQDGAAVPAPVEAAAEQLQALDLSHARMSELLKKPESE